MNRRFPRSLAGLFGLLLWTCLLVQPAFAVDPSSARWVPLKAKNSPSARAASAMAYDPVSQKVILFGGFDYSSYLNETWAFDGTTWTKLATPVAPSGRAASNMAYDKVSKKLVLFGGYDGNRYLNETWIWDGATLQWTQAHPKASPRGSTAPAVFTDPRSHTVTTYGGFDGRFYQLETWRWRAGNWHRLRPADIPTARGAMVSAYDPVRANVVIFAGLAAVNPYNTWTWDGINWTRQAPSTLPPYRYFGGATFDPNFNSVICFGGGLSGADLSDTWAWTGTDWIQMTPDGLIPARESFGIAYDEVLGKTVVFGGQLGGKLLRDTWVLEAR
jgi:hypothetical protein